MMCLQAANWVRMAIAAVVMTVAGSVVLCAPAHAFDPDRPQRRGGAYNSRVLPNGLLPPTSPIQPALPPESGLPHGMKPPYPTPAYVPPPYPTQRQPNRHGDEVEPREGDREPSALYPSDDRDRRALQQMMGHDRARAAVQTGTIRSLTEIRGQVRRQFDGRIVGVELYENRMGAGPDWVYDVRVLNPRGNVVAVEMDARTGRVLTVRGQQ